MTIPSKGPNYQDSISSGTNYYSNPYREDPGFRKAQRVAVDGARRVDSILSERQRIEQDLQNQFQNNLRLPPGSLLLAFEVGRYIVLAIIMPPYYLLFEAPKWCFEQIKPFLFAGMEKGADLLKQIQSSMVLNLKKLYQLTVKKPSKIIQNLIKKLAKPKSVSQLQDRFTNLPTTILKVALKPLQFLTHRLGEGLTHLRFKERAFRQNFAFQTKHFYPHVKKWTKEKWLQFQNTFQAKLAKIKSTLAPYAQKLDGAVSRAVNATVRKTREGFHSAVAVPLKAVYQFVQKTALQNLWVPLQTAVRETVQNKLKTPIKKALSAIKAPLKKVAKYTTARLESIKVQAVAHLQTIVKAASIPIGFLFNLSLKIIPALQRNLKPFVIPLRHFAPSFKRLGNTLKRGVQRVIDKAGEYLKGKMADLKKWGNKGKEAVKNGAVLVIKKIKQIPENLFQKLRKVIFWLKEMLAKFFKSLKIAFIWVKILVRYSFQQSRGPSELRKKK
jgi:hypothetical protein